MLYITLYDEKTFSNEIVGECSIFADQLKTDCDQKIAHTLLHETKKIGEVFLISNYLAPPADEKEEKKVEAEPQQVIVQDPTPVQ